MIRGLREEGKGETDRREEGGRERPFMWQSFKFVVACCLVDGAPEVRKRMDDRPYQ